MHLDRWPLSPSDEDDDGEGDGEVEAVESSAALLSQSPDTFMIGFVIANIVGDQYYSGTITGREMVGLVREPLNPYDENAIRVLNTRTVQVDHIERATASVLAPVVDSNLILIEGIVPNIPSRGNRFKIPCQFHIFAWIEAFARVKSSINRGGLHLISDNDASFSLSKKGVMEAMEAPKVGMY